MPLNKETKPNLRIQVVATTLPWHKKDMQFSLTLLVYVNVHTYTDAVYVFTNSVTSISRGSLDSHSLSLLPDPLWSGVIVFKFSSLCQIDLFKFYLYSIGLGDKKKTLQKIFEYEQAINAIP